MPDTGNSLPLVSIGILFFSAAASVTAIVGLLYWAIHNLGNDLRHEMQQMEQRLRDEMHQMEHRLRADLYEGLGRLEGVFKKAPT